MTAQRRFETLDVTEIRHLMQLAIEAVLHTGDGFNPVLARAYGELAAEFSFELWSREQALKRVRSNTH